MAFSEAQVKNLEAKLDVKHVRTRQVQDTTLTYVEGWYVIAEANRIFGYDAWDRHTLSTRCVWSGSGNQYYAAAYIAKVRIAVRAGAITITREGCGSGNARALTPGEAHELSLKAAETDATKRALATFGNPFGLALYDRELAGVKNRKALGVSAPEDYRGPWQLSLPGGAGQSFSRADEFIAALSKALTEVTDIERLFAVWERNVDTVRAINKQANRSTPHGAIGRNLVAQLKSSRHRVGKTGGRTNVKRLFGLRVAAKSRQERPRYSRAEASSLKRAPALRSRPPMPDLRPHPRPRTSHSLRSSEGNRTQSE